MRVLCREVYGGNLKHTYIPMWMSPHSQYLKVEHNRRQEKIRLCISLAVEFCTEQLHSN